MAAPRSSRILPSSPVVKACIATCLCTLAIAGCANGGSAGITIRGETIPEAAKVVDDWAVALTDGDIGRAASYFAIPSRVQNGPVPVEITDRDDALRFNRSLPCGAELVDAQERDGRLIATFTLRERPGGGVCGQGVGGRAKVAFRISDGKIAEWRRVPTAGEGGGAQPIPSDVV